MQTQTAPGSDDAEDTKPGLRNFEDLRAHRRVPVYVEVSMASENNFYAGLTDNLSTGGVFVATHQPPPIGAEVELTLHLPGRDAGHAVCGVVRWIRSFAASCEGAPPGCGIEWHRLTETELKDISAFVRQRETILYEGAA
jgi:uncharacterized protein (TIGR02266 family)